MGAKQTRYRGTGDDVRGFSLLEMMIALLILAACSKDKDIDQPSKLTDINATIRAERVWTASVADRPPTDRH